MRCFGCCFRLLATLPRFLFQTLDGHTHEVAKFELLTKTTSDNSCLMMIAVIRLSSRFNDCRYERLPHFRSLRLLALHLARSPISSHSISQPPSSQSCCLEQNGFTQHPCGHSGQWQIGHSLSAIIAPLPSPCPTWNFGFLLFIWHSLSASAGLRSSDTPNFPHLKGFSSLLALGLVLNQSQSRV